MAEPPATVLPGALPLTGLRVLDLSRLLPGPYATLVLADLGAQVDKLEDPEGDPARAFPPSVEGQGALFSGLNRNKRSLVLDLKSQDGKQALLKLVPNYDVLVESFRPGVMERLGLSYETLRKVHPGLIYCAVTGFGQTGPDRLKAGHDVGYLARAGVLGYGGPPEGPPAMPGVQVADIGGSLHSVIGILAALHERTRTGRGAFVDVSMTDGALSFLHMHLAGRMLAAGEGKPLARGRELLNGGLPSYGLYATKDGRYLAVGALEPKFFTALCERLGHPEWVEPAYGGGPGAEEVRAQLAATFRSKPLAEWRTALVGLDACVEVVAEGDEVLGDPQLQARGMFEGNVLRTPLGRTPVAKAPSLGEHTQEILERKPAG